MIYFLFVFSLLNFTFTLAQESQEQTCGQSSQTLTRIDMLPPWHRLVGGIETIPHAWPWTVELLFKGHHHCGGALIHPEIILTAAHCFGRSRIPKSYEIMVGGHELFTGSSHTISTILIHPYYHHIMNSAYDAALVRISPPVNISEASPNAGLICMPSSIPPVGQMCIVTGWGYESETGRRTGVLREIHVPIIQPFKCNDAWHYNGRLHLPTMFCAGYSMGKVDSCQGDSGGPLFCFNKAKKCWELNGIVSWGIGCAKPGFPGVYTKVFTLLPWINTSIKNILK